MKKKVLYIIVSIIIIFAVFITEESLRLHLNNNATPILVIDKTKCNRKMYCALVTINIQKTIGV